MPSSDPAVLDVVVIGAGQAGLAIGYHLSRRRTRFLIVDAGSEVGHVWRSRWDSLRLFTPAEYDALPGLPFPAVAGSYPTKDEVADYLRDYAEHFSLPVRLNTRVTALERAGDSFTLSTSTGTVRARQVVVATGPFQQPYVPSIAAHAAPDIAQVHSAHYRNPSQLPRGGRVLVVGGANSGLQIAEDLALNHTVSVAVGSRPPRLPQRLLGHDLFFWLTSLGAMTMPADRRIARRIRARGDIVVGSSTRKLRRRGVEFRPRLVGFAGRSALFADGTTAEVNAVVWATGYRNDYSWLRIPGVVVDDRVDHSRGVTAVAGLHFLGLPWQSSRGSGLLGFVKNDAAWLTNHIAATNGCRPLVTSALSAA